MKCGIIGNAADKFTPETEAAAQILIRELLSQPAVTHVVSGHCPLGGIDIWAEDRADELQVAKLIYPPKSRSWQSGYKPRNIKIAKNSDEVHVIVVADYPPNYTARRFPECYHCHVSTHVKSGACWTALLARQYGKPAFWHVI